jgi:hypothetical protein
VTQAAIENLVTGFMRTWQRPPTEEELQGLVRDYIREEAAYREALALGLDRDDMIVRRRLRQNLNSFRTIWLREQNPATRNCGAFYKHIKNRSRLSHSSHFNKFISIPSCTVKTLDWRKQPEHKFAPSVRRGFECFAIFQQLLAIGHRLPLGLFSNSHKPRILDHYSGLHLKTCNNLRIDRDSAQ